MDRNTVGQWQTLPAGRAAGGIDAGLRSHLLHVYNLMAGGLALRFVLVSAGQASHWHRLP